MKSKSFMLMILSMGFGLIAAIGISQVMGQKQTTAAPVTKMGPVVVAADHLDMKTYLTEKNVKIENWPANIIPEEAVTSLDQIKDMAIRTRMSKGMPLIKTAMVNKNRMSTLTIPEGFKVVAIKVSGDDLIGGLLEPGDKVDVIGLFKRRSGNKSQTTTRTFLKALRVFSVNSKMAASSDRTEGGSSGSAIVGVLVTEKQSEDIYFVQQTGEIKLVLRGDYVETDGDVESLADIMAGDAPAPKPVEEETDNTRSLYQGLAMDGIRSEMIIWNGNSPEKVVFQAGSLPSRSSNPSAPADLDDEEDEDDEEESVSSDEIDRSLEQDQYRGE